MKSMVAFRTDEFVLTSREVLPKRRTCVKRKSQWFNNLLSLQFTTTLVQQQCSQEGASFILKQRTVEEEMSTFFDINIAPINKQGLRSLVFKLMLMHVTEISAQSGYLQNYGSLKITPQELQNIFIARIIIQLFPLNNS